MGNGQLCGTLEWLACQSQLIKTQFPQIEIVIEFTGFLGFIDLPLEQDTPHLQNLWIGRTDKQNEQLREDLWQDFAGGAGIVTFSHIKRRVLRCPALSCAPLNPNTIAKWPPKKAEREFKRKASRKGESWPKSLRARRGGGRTRTFCLR